MSTIPSLPALRAREAAPFGPRSLQAVHVPQRQIAPNGLAADASCNPQLLHTPSPATNPVARRPTGRSLSSLSARTGEPSLAASELALLWQHQQRQARRRVASPVVTFSPPATRVSSSPSPVRRSAALPPLCFRPPPAPPPPPTPPQPLLPLASSSSSLSSPPPVRLQCTGPVAKSFFVTLPHAAPYVPPPAGLPSDTLPTVQRPLLVDASSLASPHAMNAVGPHPSPPRAAAPPHVAPSSAASHFAASAAASATAAAASLSAAPQPPPLAAEAPATSMQSPSAPPGTLPRPELEVFSAFSNAKPGNIPLLVRMPSGSCEQLSVPVSTTIDDLTNTIQGENGDGLRLSFGKADLDPSSTLLDTNIVDAYEHAGSLLQVIGSNQQDAETKVAALESACAVVESISNGIKDMEALCTAAINPDLAFPTSPPPASPALPAHHSLEHAENGVASQSEPPPPAALALSLSKRLPNLFPLPGSADAAAEQPQQQQQQAPQTLSRKKSAAVPQPSISSIRDARQRARRAAAVVAAYAPDGQDGELGEGGEDDQDNIGCSTFAGPLPDDMTDSAPTDPSSRAPRPRSSVPDLPNVVLTNSGKTTWVEDIMTTWEVGVVRQSGVLENTKAGQDLNDYIKSLEMEAQREAKEASAAAAAAEVEDGEGATNENDAVPGDSSDEEDESQSASRSEASIGTLHANGVVPSRENDSSLQRSMARVALSESNKAASVSNAVHSQASAAMPSGQNSTMSSGMASSSVELQRTRVSIPTAPTGAVTSSYATATSVGSSHAPMVAVSPSVAQPPPLPQNMVANISYSASPSVLTLPVQRAAPANVSVANSAQSPSPTMSAQTSDASLHSDASCMASAAPRRRQATPIAPAPTIGNPARVPLPVGSEILGQQLYPVHGAPYSQPPITVPGPKKRGRKRKFPQLTEEERARARKEQNRESARMSRVRRKVIAAEYEGRLSDLVGENSMLRKQVEALNNRLGYLQSLLTVTVRQEPPSQ